MKNRKRFVIPIILVIITTTAFILVSNEPDYEYTLISSNVLNQEGYIFGVKENGLVELIEEVDFQDLTNYTYSNSSFVISGQRRNDNIIYSNDGSWDSFNFLDNPNYTGVLNVNILNNDIYGIMNGGFRDGKYITLLAKHGFQQDEFETIELELYPRDSIITENVLIIVGNTYLNDIWVAELVVVDLVEFKIKDVIIDFDNYRFNNVAVDNEYIYLVTENFDYLTNEILILNKENYNTVDDIKFDYILLDILISDMIYVFSNSDILICDNSLNIIDNISLTYSQQSYLEQVTMIDDKIYLFIREGKNSDLYILDDVIGYVVKFDVSNNFIEKDTTIIIHNKDLIENIVIIPSAFFE